MPRTDWSTHRQTGRVPTHAAASGRALLWVRRIGIGALLLGLGACDLATGPHYQFVRIRNTGTVPLTMLTVYFPHDSVQFAEIAPGATTGYVKVREAHSSPGYRFA